MNDIETTNQILDELHVVDLEERQYLRTIGEIHFKNLESKYLIDSEDCPENGQK